MRRNFKEQNTTDSADTGNTDYGEYYVDSDENNYSYEDYDEAMDYFADTNPSQVILTKNFTPTLRPSNSRQPTPGKITETNNPLNTREINYQDGS